MKCIGKFTDFYIDVTKQGLKIPQDKYLANGKYPIIDQGKSDISGYCNNLEGIFNDVPAIIFGDHTRSIKYVEKPFFIGADGVKILKSINKNNNMKYLYYALLAAKIPNLGYSRHFKILKELNINIYSRKEQDYIVRLLEKVDCLSESYRKYLFYLNKIIKSRFIEMFGNPVLNTKNWYSCAISEKSNCMVPGRDKPKSFTGDIPWITIDDLIVNGVTYKSKKGLGLTTGEIKDVKRSTIPAGSIIMSCVGNLGVCSIAGIPMVINQQLHSFQCNNELNNIFAMRYLEYRKDYMNSRATNTTVLYMNKAVCSSIPIIVPPIELQNEFAEFVQQVDKSKYREISLIKTYQIAEKYIKQEWMRCQTLHS